MVLARVLLILLPRLQTLTLSTYSTTSHPAAKVNLFVYCSRRVAIYHPANPLLRPFREYLHVYEIGTQHKSMVVESQIRVLNLPLTISNEGDAGGMEFFDSPEIRDRC